MNSSAALVSPSQNMKCQRCPHWNRQTELHPDISKCHEECENLCDYIQDKGAFHLPIYRGPCIILSILYANF